MIIQILSNLYDEGYVDKNEDMLVSPFFSNSNVAFRREVFDSIGVYDPKCTTGEDQDISIRALNAGWDLFFQAKAVIGHRCRKTTRQFLRQWFNYGYHHPYLFKKHSPHAVSFYVKKNNPDKSSLYKRFFGLKSFPFSAYIFLGPFFLMNVLLLFTLISLLVPFKIVSIGLGILTFFVSLFYFRHDMHARSLFLTPKFIILRCLANSALFIGGFIGGMKLKIVYICGTLDHRNEESRH